MKIRKRLEHLSCEERQKDLGLFSLELNRNSGMISLTFMNIWRMGAKETEPLLRFFSVVSSGPWETKWNKGSSHWKSSSTSVLCRWWSSDTGCPGKLWCLLHRDLQKLPRQSFECPRTGKGLSRWTLKTPQPSYERTRFPSLLIFYV